jgi:hypothetical protein
MKRITLTFCAATLLLFACTNDKTTSETKTDATSDKASAESADKPKEKEWIPIDSAMEMKAMMEAGTLGEAHKMMAKSAGTWAADVTWWPGIGAPEGKSKGTSVNTMILGGHYLQSKFSGDMMGMPFEGISTMAYDNTAKEYVSTWIENMSTSMMIMKGTMDNATNTINLTGKQKNPANGIECTLREVFKIVDDNNQVMEMYGPDRQTGKEYKMMEIKYTRKK